VGGRGTFVRSVGLQCWEGTGEENMYNSGWMFCCQIEKLETFRPKQWRIWVSSFNCVGHLDLDLD
jgi:hypothetical protein